MATDSASRTAMLLGSQGISPELRMFLLALAETGDRNDAERLVGFNIGSFAYQWLVARGFIDEAGQIGWQQLEAAAF